MASCHFKQLQQWVALLSCGTRVCQRYQRRLRMSLASFNTKSYLLQEVDNGTHEFLPLSPTRIHPLKSNARAFGGLHAQNHAVHTHAIFHLFVHVRPDEDVFAQVLHREVKLNLLDCHARHVCLLFFGAGHFGAEGLGVVRRAPNIRSLPSPSSLAVSSSIPPPPSLPTSLVVVPRRSSPPPSSPPPPPPPPRCWRQLSAELDARPPCLVLSPLAPFFPFRWGVSATASTRVHFTGAEAGLAFPALLVLIILPCRRTIWVVSTSLVETALALALDPHVLLALSGPPHLCTLNRGAPFLVLVPLRKREKRLSWDEIFRWFPSLRPSPTPQTHFQLHEPI